MSRRSARLLACSAAVIVGAATVGACGSSSTKATAKRPTTTIPADAPKVKKYGPGVTATTVKVGVMMIDFGCIPKGFVDPRPTQQKTFDLYINYINSHGGVAGGKQIIPVWKTYCPLTNTGELAACTSLTEDNNVFATIGIFYDPTGDAQLCFAKQHNTPIIADQLTQELADKAPPGLMVTPDITPERRLRVILTLLKRHGTFKGKTVGVLGEATARSRIDSVVTPAIGDMGAKKGSVALLTVSGADTTAAQRQLDSFIERWKTEHVDALMLIGSAASSQEFVDKTRKALPDVTLVADTTSVLDQARQEQKRHAKPNPYDGVMTAEGQTGLEHTKTRHAKFCHGIYRAATGKAVPSPNAIVKDSHGTKIDQYGEIEDGCLFPMMFKAIADRVGPYLNAENWANAVNHFGPIEDMSTIYASLHQGKYDADDTYQLVAYDPSIPELGDWKSLSPIENVSGA